MIAAKGEHRTHILAKRTNDRQKKTALCVIQLCLLCLSNSSLHSFIYFFFCFVFRASVCALFDRFLSKVFCWNTLRAMATNEKENNTKCPNDGLPTSWSNACLNVAKLWYLMMCAPFFLENINKCFFFSVLNDSRKKLLFGFNKQKWPYQHA